GGWHSLATGHFPGAARLNASDQDQESGASAEGAIYAAAWGDNTYGQLSLESWFPVEDEGESTYIGYAADYVHFTPQNAGGAATARIPLMDSVAQIAAGYYHTIFLRGNLGIAYAAGRASEGQLGNAGAMADAKEEADKGRFVTLALPMSHPTPYGTDDKCLAVAAGENFTALLVGDGSMEVNTEDGIPDIRIYKADVYVLGANTDGQTGSLALDSEGFYSPSGSVEDYDLARKYKRISLPTNMTGTAQALEAGSIVNGLTAGGRHVVAYTDHGELFAWGKNEFGQLGEFSLVDRGTTHQSGFSAAYIPQVAGVVNYGSERPYDVWMVTKRNGELWPGGADWDYQLVLNTPKKTTIALTPNTVDGQLLYYAPQVPGGSYTIMARAKSAGASGEWENTGTVVEVKKGRDFLTDPAVVNFFSVHFSVEDKNAGKSEPSTISATYTIGDKTIDVTDGQVVWGGGTLVVHAVGQGGVVPDYLYDWTVEPDSIVYDDPEERPRYDENDDEHSSESDQATVDGYLTVDEVTSQVTVKCLVIDPVYQTLTVKVLRNNESWTTCDKSLFIKSSYRSIQLEQDETDKSVYRAENVPQGQYYIYEGSAANYRTGLKGPMLIDLQKDQTENLNYYSLDNVQAVAKNGVSYVKVSVNYAILNSKGQYQADGMAGELANVTGKEAMEGATLLVSAETYVSTMATVFAAATSTWTDLSQLGDPLGFTPVNELTRGNNLFSQVFVLNGQVGTQNTPEMLITANGNVQDSASKKYMALKFNLNGAAWDGVGYTFTLESDRSRSSKHGPFGTGTGDASGDNRVWASYPLSYNASKGVFEAYDVPLDYYMLYMENPNGVKIPVMDAAFQLTKTGYAVVVWEKGNPTLVTKTAQTDPLTVDFRRISLQLSALSNGSITPNAYVKVISGFNNNLTIPGDGGNGLFSGGFSADGTILASKNPVPEYNVQTLAMLSADSTATYASADVVVPVGNTISLQVQGTGAKTFNAYIMRNPEEVEGNGGMAIGTIIGQVKSVDGTLSAGEHAPNEPLIISTDAAAAARNPFPMGNGEDADP
ncbi:MAG: hypothetical protein NC131_21505, partial [Roseburia sp.]|nr:hypothetical protein [Roseburia sp.]